MRVLIAAIACQPKGGSEGYVGWSCVNAISMDHEVHVITSGMCQKEIEEELAKHPRRSKFSFTFIGEPIRWHENRLIARAQSWMQYSRWVKEASKMARTLSEERHFDILHHITYATWRMGTPLAGLGKPLIFGPVGGGEKFPLSFINMLSPLSAVFELARSASGWLAKRSKQVLQSISTSTLLLTNNRETQELFLSFGVSGSKIEIMSQSFLSAERMEQLKCTQPKSDPQEKLIIFAGGNLEGRKGVAIVLRALSILSQWKIPYEFTYGGKGPELSYLDQLAKKLRLSKINIKLGQVLTQESYLRELRRSHIYLLPSLREGAPVTMMEAMAASCVPVVGKCGGAAMLVNGDCGRLIPITSPSEMAEEIADKLRFLWKNPGVLKKMGNSARLRVNEKCSEEFYRKQINRYYQNVAAKESVEMQEK
jgi:glycosyltransferase involved in cell wall biosynthesis